MDQDSGFRLDFIGIGAAKCGTTWLAALLDQHPDICMPAGKEAAYFNAKGFFGEDNRNAELGLHYYHQHWDPLGRKGRICGEWSPQYLNDPTAAARIQGYNPNIKLLVALRDPIRRGMSHFLFEQQFNGRIPKSMSFQEASRAFPFILNAGLYHHQLKPFMDRFPAESFKIVVLEEFLKDPRSSIQSLYGFLGVDTDFVPDLSPKNQSKQIAVKGLDLLLQTPGKYFRSLETRMRASSSGGGVIRGSKIFRRLRDWKNQIRDKNTRELEKPDEESFYSAELIEFFAADVAALRGSGLAEPVSWLERRDQS